jgi:hypothetical protein
MHTTEPWVSRKDVEYVVQIMCQGEYSCEDTLRQLLCAGELYTEHAGRSYVCLVIYVRYVCVCVCVSLEHSALAAVRGRLVHRAYWHVICVSRVV